MSRVAVGLPTNPRSRLAGPVAPDTLRRQPEEQSRSLRTIPSTRGRQSPFQRGPVQEIAQRPPPRPRNLHREPSSRLSIASASTTSSSGSSFWERGSTTSSQSSTRTSSREPDVEYVQVEHRDALKNESAFASYADTGLVWTRMTEAAAALTQEVGKVWATGLTSVPLGQGGDDEGDGESHLTKVMRSYHLSKARTPAELPDWLFSERERGLKGTLCVDPATDRSQGVPSPAQLARRRTRPDGYTPERPTATDAMSEKMYHARTTPEARALVQPRPAGSDRLKMMRDLKRNATTVRVDGRGRI